MNLKIKNYPNYIQQFRTKHIPKEYNQVQLLDELNNKEVDHFISISSRTDGKSFNYVHALLNIAIDYNLGLMFVTRNMRLRTSYMTLIDDIIEISSVLNQGDITYVRTHYYIQVNYKKRVLAIITDLDQAGELKNFSSFIKKFPIVVYDEFITIPSDYLIDEWERLQTIYRSIEREDEYPLIGYPKILYLGNAMNFDSPVLHGLKIFNVIENHEMNSMRVYYEEFHFALEIQRNENQNEKRNTRAFGSAFDAMSTAEFSINKYNIATEDDRNEVKRNPRIIYVKIRESYLRIWFNRDTMKIILNIESYTKNDYQFCIDLKDLKDDVTFLNEKYFDEKHFKRYENGSYLFDNSFSKNYITSDFSGLKFLKINKIIRKYLRTDSPTVEREAHEQQFQENYIEQTKKGLMRKFWE